MNWTSSLKYIAYLFFVTFLVLNILALVAIKVGWGVWFLSSDYEDRKQAKYADYANHNFPHPYLGYSRTWLSGTEDSGFQEKLFWDVYQTDGYQKTDPTVLILGGSVAAHLSNNADGREQDGRWGKNAFAETLGSKYPDAEFRVLNAAYAGRKQPQQYITAVYLDLIGVDYDLVINLDGYNEVALPLTENLAQSTPAIFPRSYFYQVAAFGNSSCIEERRNYSGLLSYMPFFDLLNAVLLKRCVDSVKFPPKLILPNDSHEQVLSEGLAESVEIWKRSSDRLYDFLAARNIAYIHAVQPSQYLPGAKQLTDEEREQAFEMTAREELVIQYYPMLEADALATPYVSDLRYAFKDNDETLYRDKCCHFNDKGMRLISQTIIGDHRGLFDRLLSGRPAARDR